MKVSNRVLGIAAGIFCLSAAAWCQETTHQDSLLPQTAPEQKVWRPMSTDERIDWFLKRTTGRTALIRGLAFSGLSTLRNSPEEWNRDLDGFGQRVASRQARSAINHSVQLGMGFLLKDDPRYQRAPEKGVGGRLKNAFVSAFTVRDATGGRAPAYGRFAGIAVSNVIERTWMPPSRNSWGDVAARSGSQLGVQVGWNLLREFLPDLKRKFK